MDSITNGTETTIDVTKTSSNGAETTIDVTETSSNGTATEAGKHSEKVVITTTIDDLPEEILENLFHRLPHKTLGSCMCVKKQWLYLVKNPDFISSNLKKQLMIITSNPRQMEMYIDNDRFEFYKKFTLPSLGIYNEESAISSCNGLICFGRKISGEVVLWNPTIRKMLTLPRPAAIRSYVQKHINKQYLGLGFDSLSDDYKIVRIRHGNRNNHSAVEVFSLNSYSWKTVSETAPKYKFEGPSQFLHNTVHWLDFSKRDNLNLPVIVGFNLNTESIQEIEIELTDYWRWIGSGGMKLSIYNQSSIAVCCSDFMREELLEVWIMKEYGVKESWTKLWTINKEMNPLRGRRVCGEILGLRYEGQVLWRLERAWTNRKDSHLDYVYTSSTNPDAEPRYSFLTHWDYQLHRGVRYFEETLVLLDNADAVDYP